MQEFIKKIRNNEIDLVEHTHKVIKQCKKINKEYNYFNVIYEDLDIEQAEDWHKRIKHNEKNAIRKINNWHLTAGRLYYTRDSGPESCHRIR